MSTNNNDPSRAPAVPAAAGVPPHLLDLAARCDEFAADDEPDPDHLRWTLQQCAAEFRGLFSPGPAPAAVQDARGVPALWQVVTETEPPLGTWVLASFSDGDHEVAVRHPEGWWANGERLDPPDLWMAIPARPEPAHYEEDYQPGNRAPWRASADRPSGTPPAATQQQGADDERGRLKQELSEANDLVDLVAEVLDKGYLQEGEDLGDAVVRLWNECMDLLDACRVHERERASLHARFVQQIEDNGTVADLLLKSAGEVQRLRAAIVDAPHEPGCARTGCSLCDGGPADLAIPHHRCTCWKARTLQGSAGSAGEGTDGR